MAQLNSLSIGGQPVADFIVDSGTDGIWDYVKYNSGRYEAWYRNDNFGPMDVNDNSIGNKVIYLSPRNLEWCIFDFPSFSVSCTSYTGTASSTTTYSWGLIWCEELNGKDVIRFRIASITAASNVPCRVSLQITGRWK